jgi:hypothetical protein
MGGIAKLSLVDWAINYQTDLGLSAQQVSQLILIRQTFHAAALPLVAQAKKVRMAFEVIVDAFPFDYQQALGRIDELRDVGRTLDNLYLDKMVEVDTVLSHDQGEQLLAIYDSEAAQYLSGLVKPSLSPSEVDLVRAKAQQVLSVLQQSPDPTADQIREMAKWLYQPLEAVGILPVWKEN